MKKYENLELAVLTATPIRHVIMLYEGLIEALQTALEVMKSGSEEIEDLKRKYENLEKATDILTALELTLNEKEGGEIAKRLHEIYVSIGNDITRISIKGDEPQTIEKAIRVLSELKEAWEDVEKQLYKGG